MASALHNLSNYALEEVPNAESYSFGIVVSGYHANITNALLEGCVNTLQRHHVDDEHIHTIVVPGTYELVAGAHQLLRAQHLHAVICLGCVIKGDTDHDVYINHTVAQGLAQLTITHNRPVIFGVLTPNTEQQAIDRAGGKHGNKGVEAAITAIKMADLYRQLT